jgi:hypothetical protein
MTAKFYEKLTSSADVCCCDARLTGRGLSKRTIIRAIKAALQTCDFLKFEKWTGGLTTFEFVSPIRKNKVPNVWHSRL